MLLLVGDGDAESGDRQRSGQGKKILQLRRLDQKRQVDRVQTMGLKRAIVHGRRDGVAHRIGDDAVDLGGAGELFGAIEMAQHARAHLAGRGAIGSIGRGVGKHAAPGGGQHARRKPGFAHGQDHQRRAGVGFGERQNARVVGWLARGGDDLVAVGGNAQHAAQNGFGRRRAIVVVIRKHQLAFSAQRLQARDGILGAFDFDVHGASAGVECGVQNPDLVFHAAVEFSVILMAPAGGQNAAFRMRGEKLADDGDALLGRGQVIQAELEEGFAGVGFAARVFQQLLRVGKAHGDADPR